MFIPFVTSWRVRLAIALAFFALVPGARAQDRPGPRPAPLYALPADGTWVEYEWNAVGSDKEAREGLLRISSVGSTNASDEVQRWLEIRKETQARPEQARIRKLLLSEKALAQGVPWTDAVAVVYDRVEPDGPVVRLSASRARDFLTLGMPRDDVRLREVRDKEMVEGKLGKRAARHMSAEAPGNGRRLQYHVWLTEDVPYGWVKMEVWEARPDEAFRKIFTATAVRTGKGAKSEIDEVVSPLVSVAKGAARAA